MDWNSKKTRKFRHRQGRGFSLIELLVVIGIISILMGLLLPAVQAVREAARGLSCKNHLRQLGLATANFESTFEYLPGPWFSAPLDSPNYRSDRGLFVQLLPYFEQQNLYDQLKAAGTTFDLANTAALSERQALLTCPSSSANPTLLTDTSARFSGPPVAGLNSVTCDYIGNGGYDPSTTISPDLTDGPVGVQMAGSVVPRETMGRVLDGASHTLFIWESIGSVIIPAGGGNLELDVNTQAENSFTLSIYGAPTLNYPSNGIASSKSYLHSWAGLRLGNMREIGGVVVNVGNRMGEPCSRHPGGAHAVSLGGSVHLLPSDLSPQVGFALSSARGREVVRDF
jgi:prepilin-type N-terminal cleavage/methylation domain-containing protein